MKSRVALVTMSAALLVVAAEALAIYPEVEVAVARVDGRYKFSFRNRSGDVPIRWVVVSEMSGGRKGGSVCEIRSDKPKSRLMNSWIYGESPDGYERRGCGPLSSGTYHLEMSGGGGGSLVFRIGKEGEVTIIPEQKSGC